MWSIGIFLILDDILDSGHTLAAIREKLETAKPRSIRICVLLEQKKQRARQVDADYVGFEIEDEFVVGYGLDFMEQLSQPSLHRRAAEGIACATSLIMSMNVRVQFYAQLRDLAGTRPS